MGPKSTRLDGGPRDGRLCCGDLTGLPECSEGGRSFLMGFGLRIFVGDDYGLTPVSQARWQRIMSGSELLPQFANRELRALEVVVEIDRRLVLRPIRVLPTLTKINASGKVDMPYHMAQAMERVSHSLKPPSVETAIRQLQLDASHFWVLTEMHWEMLSRLLKLPVNDLKQALHSAPHPRE